MVTALSIQIDPFASKLMWGEEEEEGERGTIGNILLQCITYKILASSTIIQLLKSVASVKIAKYLFIKRCKIAYLLDTIYKRTIKYLENRKEFRETGSQTDRQCVVPPISNIIHRQGQGQG